ncbi:MAG: protoglobin domain-containing protein [Phycisphaerales bacterium]|nr:protoglobin domain-containing protein [Phycisphaerales bacterium]
MLNRKMITLSISTIACLGACSSMQAMNETIEPGIAGYTHGSRSVERAPITLAELEELKLSLLMSDEDIKYLRMSYKVLEPNVEELVGVWYGFVGSNPHLLKYFSNAASEPDMEYLGRVRARFERWVLDTAQADYDQDWLDYQFEIGRRHHRIGKNKTDHANAIDHINFRHLSALTIPVTTTLKPFLERGDHTSEEVDKMHAAWVKSVLMQSILWSYPYVQDGDF